ncbi:energy-coupling factor ABC transporter ATP-binding protein [Salarchaeum sp. JOR-1]|uniref:energy-coupling factor ABC transporter ATP-binding protein n=1 Tax=Salarchaeum sp. JOR-1 TaxID=2599399 RepID=UPI001198BB5F|nr:ABC transporter ATP-binding protein [Salarchaeum sp. JOR-1]QDX40296.1 ABC transporter ATP-binding protein [Salarchaeum sp. JOR-1]
MISADSLVHEYGGTRALDGVTLDISDGEFVVVAGANGSGKTTLVRHFNGLLEPDAGDVRVNGTPVADDLVAARASVGMVFQDPRDQFVAGTVREDVAFGPENLGLPREEIEERVAAALDAVNMTGRGDDLLSRLSGGEQERVAIAGVLAMRPDHVVLDEPFTGLDQPARESVLARLDALHDAGTSLVVVTHDLRDVFERADRVCLISEGRVLADGAPDDVRDRLSAASVRDPC